MEREGPHALPYTIPKSRWTHPVHTSVRVDFICWRRACRCCRKPMKGATPVPGPTSTKGHLALPVCRRAGGGCG